MKACNQIPTYSSHYIFWMIKQKWRKCGVRANKSTKTILVLYTCESIKRIEIKDNGKLILNDRL